MYLLRGIPTQPHIQLVYWLHYSMGTTHWGEAGPESNPPDHLWTTRGGLSTSVAQNPRSWETG